jgi:hypothetical protein
MPSLLVSLVVAVAVSGCWTDRAPARTTPTPPSSASSADVSPATSSPATDDTRASRDTRDYRAVTLTLDAVGVASLATGLVLLHHSSSDDGPGALIDAGALIGGFGAITAHLIAGRTDRAWRSYLIRGGLMMATSLTGMMVACPGGTELGCTIEGMAWGMAAGIAIAAPIDAFVLQRAEGSWTPTVVPREGGATAGIGGTF